MTPIGGVVVVWAACVASVAVWGYALSGLRARRLRRDPVDIDVLALRPCKGREPNLADALLSSSSLPAGSTTRFLLASKDDEAFGTAFAAVEVLIRGGRRASVVVTGPGGPNGKVAQLASALANEPRAPSVLVCADSDVLLDAAAIETLVGPIARSELDAAWAPPVELRGTTLGDRASAAVLDASLHAFALLSALDPRTMVGKAFAVKREALDRIGGLAPLTMYLGEDMELARRLRRRGLRVGAVSRPAVSVASGRRLVQVVDRFARWLMVIRAQRSALLLSYPLLFASAPLQLLALVFARARGEPRTLAFALLVVGVRVTIGALARHRSGRPLGLAQLPLDVVLADITLLAAFFRALTLRTFVWRGTPMRIGKRGLLELGGRTGWGS